jgi:hypothetical protein
MAHNNISELITIIFFVYFCIYYYRVRTGKTKLGVKGEIKRQKLLETKHGKTIEDALYALLFFSTVMIIILYALSWFLDLKGII